ncbi:MAG: ribosomal protein L7/L12 [Phycisphaerales bacterium]
MALLLNGQSYDVSSLAEAKALVDVPGKAIKQGLDKAEAEKLKKTITDAGGTVDLV